MPVQRKGVIPVGMPALVGNEKAYVLDCLETTWISGTGKYIDRFETKFAAFCGGKHAISCCNGTAALHLALAALGVGCGDEVIVPTLTFVATANAVRHSGAKPVFVDVEPDTWNIDPALIQEAITPRTKAVVAVHLYGHPADMDPLLSVAREAGLFVIEDCAEAHGAQYKSKTVGSLADAATFSFYANKIISTGEGGAVVTDSTSVDARIRQLAAHGSDPSRRYFFPVVGFNYRMSNIEAAIGLAQMEKANWHIDRRREVASWYSQHLSKMDCLTLPIERAEMRNVYWMYSVILDESLAITRDSVMQRLGDAGIETRPLFPAIHTLPPYASSGGKVSFPIAERLAARGISLPTWAGMTIEDVSYICDALGEAISG
jgi:perosamine synthetase